MPLPVVSEVPGSLRSLLGPHLVGSVWCFRVYAPSVFELQLDSPALRYPAALSPVGDGVWEVVLRELGEGALYRLRFRDSSWGFAPDPFAPAASESGWSVVTVSVSGVVSS